MHFNDTMALQTKKEDFITMISNSLKTAGCGVYHANDDADVLVVEVTVDCAEYIEAFSLQMTHIYWFS